MRECVNMKKKLEVRNIKVSLFINKPIHIDQKLQILNPLDSVKITIYKHSPRLINITGVESFRKLRLVKKFIKYHYCCKILRERIDSIMLNYKSLKHMKINLNRLSKVCEQIADYNLDYNCEIFNAPFLKSKSEKGTLLLFSSGSIQVMGCKKIEHIEHNEKLVNTIFSMYKKEVMKERLEMIRERSVGGG